MIVIEFLVVLFAAFVAWIVWHWLDNCQMDRWLKNTPPAPPLKIRSTFDAKPEPDDPKIAAMLAQERAERKQAAIERLRSLRQD